MNIGKNIFAVIVFITILATIAPFAYATPQASPLAGNISLEKTSEPIVVEGTGTPQGFEGKIKHCTNTQIYLRESTKLQFVPYLGKDEIKRIICAVRTPAGLAGDGYFVPTGASVGGKLEPPTNQTIHTMYAVSNSTNIIGLHTIGNGTAYIHLIKGAYSGVRAIKNSDGTVSYAITKPASSRLQTNNGIDISVKVETIAFSNNGEWMVADSENAGAIRLHIASGQVTSFDSSLVYNLGYNPNTQFAVSNSGRFVTRTSYSQNSFYSYDLEVCSGTNPRSPYNSFCYKKDMQPVVKTLLPTHTGGANRLEYSGDVLHFVTMYDQVASRVGFVSFVKLAASTTEAQQANIAKIDYLALGDSFASGEGVYNYKAVTDTPDNRCHLSYDSYPYVIDSTLSTIGATESVACSGAKTKDYYFYDQRVYNTSEKQSIGKETLEFDELIYDNYLPGYRIQDNFVLRKKPNIVTISMGGNDIGFSSILKSCVAGSNDCYKFYEDRAALVSTVNNTYTKLVDTYTSIKANTNTSAKVYVIGYPLIAKADGNCAVNVLMNSNELAFGNSLVEYLNAVIEMAANHAGVRYVDVSNAFSGSKLCETASSSAALNGLTAGNSSFIPDVGPIGSESYHPTKKGHALLATAITQQTNNFTLAMPTAVIGDPLTIAADKLKFVLDAPHNDSLYMSTYYQDNLTELDTYYVGDDIKLGITQYQASLPPASSYQVWLYSTPTLLGTLQTDANGELNSAVTVPGDTPPGYHTVKIVGKNLAGEDITIQKIIYIGASAADIDGDGVPNDKELCLVGEPSKTDVDADGTDDACDGYIGEPPAPLADKVLPSSESSPFSQYIRTSTAAAATTPTLTNIVAATAAPGSTAVPNTTNTQNATTVAPNPNQPQDATTVAGVSSAVAVSQPSKIQDDAALPYKLLMLVVGIGMIVVGIYMLIRHKNTYNSV